MLRGRIAGTSSSVTLAIDAEGSKLASLPWELTSIASGSLEAVSGGLVVRWASGPARTPEPRPTVALFAAKTDRATIQVLERARADLAEVGLPEVGLDDEPGIVQLVAHGEQAAGAVAVALDDGLRSAGTVSARLGEAVSRAALVVLSVCHAGSEPGATLDGVAGRLLASGAPLVLAPRHATATEAATRLAKGVYGAIANGASYGRAIAAGRRAVRAWGHPHPSSRWWAWGCWAARLDALGLVPLPQGWVPRGWPRPGPDAAPWLEAAYRDAVRRADGYVGIEHLLRTLGSTDGGGQGAAWLRRASHRTLTLWNDVAAALSPHGPPPSEPALTPRLTAFGGVLNSGFDMETLAGILIEGQLVVPGAPTPAPGAETLFTESTPNSAPPARALQVIGGPEDGRVLRPQEGDAIGRTGGIADHALYHNSRLTDRKLSRHHCTWEAPSRVRLHRTAMVQRGAHQHRMEGSVELKEGDILILSEGTRLLALGEPTAWARRG